MPHNPYGSVHNAPTNRSDSFTLRENEFLGRYTNDGLLRFRDTNAFYCQACSGIYGVYCPRCRIRSTPTHAQTYEKLFDVTDVADYWDGHNWRQIVCRKCDYRFKVIIR